MINRKLILVTVILSVVFVAVFLLSSRVPQRGAQSKRIQIVTSFYPLSHIVKGIGGNLVDVRNLVPAGVEPHDFEPSSRDLVEIGNADAILYNGGVFESWVNKWEKGNSPRPKQKINMTESLISNETMLITRDGVVDPHFWLDPIIMKKETEIVRDMFIKIDPLHRDLFTDNANRYIGTLSLLDERFRVGLSSCDLSEVVVLHEAYNYLARQYNFTATSISGISPDEEPSMKELARIISLVRAKGIQHIFAETVASPKFSELVAREVGATVLVLNPIESLTPDEVQSGQDYISIMENNLNNLRIAMQCN
ncbi:MAG TPA: hypothetical protein DCS23_01980 [Candidatus Yonathbacteria bacterium]|nr:hypothetical protein [Candidatus Yonathbacteria bacterium]